MQELKIENFQQFLAAATTFIAEKPDCNFIIIAHKMNKSVNVFRSFEDDPLTKGILEYVLDLHRQKISEHQNSPEARAAEELERNRMAVMNAPVDKGKTN